MGIFRQEIDTLAKAGLIAVLMTVALLVPLHAQGGGSSPTAAAELIQVLGQNNPALDIPALQQAINQATPDDIVELQGTFDLTGCQGGLVLNQPITLRGNVDPNIDPAGAVKLLNCGPALRVAITSTAATTLTVQNLWFQKQTPLSILIANSTGPISIIGNRFTDNEPALSPTGWGLRFAVGSANLTSATLEGLVTIEDNVIDWSGAAANATFEGDDNGFAFAATNFDIIIRNNEINTLGEGIEIEGGFGPDTHYLVEGNRLTTLVPPSPLAIVDSPENSVGAGAQGGHPAVVKLTANEGTFSILNNEVTLSGVSSGVCIMATTLNPAALTGVQNNLVQGNVCRMDDQLAGILGGWGSQPPFFEAASMHGTVVVNNVFSGTAKFGVAVIDRSLTAVSGPVINDGHMSRLQNNDFSALDAAFADIGFEQETYANSVFIRSSVTITNRGDNYILDSHRFAPLVQGE